MSKTNYNYDMQKLYLEMFLSDAETFTRCQNIFNPENFDQKLRDTAEFITTYVDKYKAMPESSIVNTACSIDLNPVALPKENYSWLLNEFESFSRHKSLERAILKSADLLEKGDYGPVEKLVKDAIQISLNKNMGTDYWEDPRSRLMKLKENNGQISTGWATVDKKLYGGFKRGELNIWCAGSGGGKSLFLANQGLNFALAGLNVIYFTFELSEELVSMRLDSMVTGTATREIFKNLDDVEMKVKMMRKKASEIQVVYMPSGKNCNDLRSYLKEYQVKFGKKPDVILVDYLDLMMPLSIKVSPSDLFVKDKYVSEELRNLAMETQCVVVTASQLNRAAVEEIEFDHSHISGGLSKIQTADNVIGIFTSRAMRERGRYQIQFMKTRSSSGVGQKVELDFNIDTLRITDPGEEEAEQSLGQMKTSPASAFVQGLKRTSVVNSSEADEKKDPSQGLSIEKIKNKPASGAPLIRTMLNNINPEKD
jgi:KaiC/GvpD/RAD55 family RecA-like ATPase